MDPGEVKPLVSRVNPAGVSTPMRPGTVAAVGNTLQGTGEAVLGLVGEPLLPRVERWWWPCLRWPVPTTATTVAAAGARLSSGSRLQRLRRCGVGTYGFYAVR